MAVELIFKSRRHGLDGELEETSAVYETVEEAMLQAAHNEMVIPGVTLRIEVDGKKVAGVTDFKKALKAYRQARNDSLSIDDQGVVSMDASLHVERMKDVVK
jgi:translation initiation factor 2 alpha subunit (eIF-2alpha)